MRQRLQQLLFGPRSTLAPELARRVAAWQQRHEVDERVSLEQARFAVVDCETSGLNVRRDRLLAIGAVTVAGARLVAGEAFELLVRQEIASARANILIHGIGPQEQASGLPPGLALVEFLERVGKRPLIAYHASFDQAVLGRALRRELGVRLPNLWLDLALLAPALFPQLRLPQASLDGWLEHFGLRARVRHRAPDDAFVTAELFLVLLARARARGVTTLSALHALCDRQGRLAPGGGVGGA
jgi:DNA polymerase-3 subunit epsilon